MLMLLVVPDFDVNVNSWLNFKVGNFRNSVRWALNVYNPGMNSHFVSVISVGT